jgi:hypothetical protein
MSSHITIMSWNMDGITFLKTDPEKRGRLKALITRQLNEECIRKHRPHFIAVQEIVRTKKTVLFKELVEPPQGYCYQSSISIDTARQNNPVKWEPIRKAGQWPSWRLSGSGERTALAQ